MECRVCNTKQGELVTCLACSQTTCVPHRHHLCSWCMGCSVQHEHDCGTLKGGYELSASKLNSLTKVMQYSYPAVTSSGLAEIIKNRGFLVVKSRDMSDDGHKKEDAEVTVANDLAEVRKSTEGFNIRTHM